MNFLNAIHPLYSASGLVVGLLVGLTGVGGGSLPESEKASKEVLALPIYPELKEEEIKYVAKQVLEAVG